MTLPGRGDTYLGTGPAICADCGSCELCGTTVDVTPAAEGALCPSCDDRAGYDEVPA